MTTKKKTNTGYKINLGEGTISTTKAFQKQAAIPGSPEFIRMGQLRKVYGDFEINANKVKVSSTKQKHKGLTLLRMERHIAAYSDETVMLEFEKQKKNFVGTSAYYAKVKSWFLAEFPDYAKSEKAKKQAATTPAVKLVKEAS